MASHRMKFAPPESKWVVLVNYYIIVVTIISSPRYMQLSRASGVGQHISSHTPVSGWRLGQSAKDVRLRCRASLGPKSELRIHSRKSFIACHTTGFTGTFLTLGDNGSAFVTSKHVKISTNRHYLQSVKLKPLSMSSQISREKTNSSIKSTSTSTKAPSKKSPKRRKNQNHHKLHNSTWSDGMNMTDTINDDEGNQDTNTLQEFARASPFPMMPSPLFINLAQSQFELLSNSLVHTLDEDGTKTTTNPKISSIALYLPKENRNTGQLEFVPAVTYPNPSSERVFIASDSSSSSSLKEDGNRVDYPSAIPVAAVLGKSPTKRLPGFTKAKDLIPTYPFVSSPTDMMMEEERGNGFGSGGGGVGVGDGDSSIGVSAVEEISTGALMGDSGPKALSVTLFSGLDTLGVLMIWPNQQSKVSLLNENSGGLNQTTNEDSADELEHIISENEQNQWVWTPNDKMQIARAAKSLALALSMDNERTSTQIQSEQFRVALADSLHQVKSPLQALRTFGKLLQRQLAEEHADGMRGGSGSTNRYGPTMQRMSVSRVPLDEDENSPWSRRQRQALRLAEDMLAQGERVVDLIEPMDSLVQNGGKYKLNGRYLLLPQKGDEAMKATSGAMILRPSISDDSSESSTIPSSEPSLLGELNMEMTFPQDILGPIVYASQAVSLEQGINFDAVGFEPDAELPGVTVCPKLYQEAVSNLLDNAIKYAPLGEHINGRKSRKKVTPQIKVTLTSNETPLSPGATLYVEDNGPGIPESEWESVFQRGYRSEAVQDVVEGSGLGLGMSKEMVLFMGGMLDIIKDGPSRLGGTTMRLIVFRDPDV